MLTAPSSFARTPSAAPLTPSTLLITSVHAPLAPVSHPQPLLTLPPLLPMHPHPSQAAGYSAAEAITWGGLRWSQGQTRHHLEQCSTPSTRSYTLSRDSVTMRRKPQPRVRPLHRMRTRYTVVHSPFIQPIAAELMAASPLMTSSGIPVSHA